jgi:hypothetical protein
MFFLRKPAFERRNSIFVTRWDIFIAGTVLSATGNKLVIAAIMISTAANKLVIAAIMLSVTGNTFKSTVMMLSATGNTFESTAILISAIGYLIYANRKGFFHCPSIFVGNGQLHPSFSTKHPAR